MVKLKKLKGFTLIEVMFAVAVLAILLVIAVETYTPYIREGRRVDAVNSLLAMSLAEERYRSNNTTYGTLAQAWGGVTTSQGGYYTLAISNVSATSYTLSATATGDQLNDKVGTTTCSPLQIAVSNGTITKTPAVCWPT